MYTASRLWRLRPVIAGFAFLAIAPFAVADPPDSQTDEKTTPKPANRLEGVVISKDGKPVAHAEVAIAHAKKGYMMIDADDINTFGSDETILLFFTKRNGKTAATTTTDDEGRFTFTNFTDPGGKWRLAARHRDHGFRLISDFVPNDHRDKPVGIQLDEAVYIVGKVPEMTLEDQTMLSTSVSLVSNEGEKPGPFGEISGAENVFFNFRHYDAIRPGKEFRIGPVPTGQKYQLGIYASSSRVGASASLFQRTVAVESGGKNVEVDLELRDGAAVSGVVTEAGGTPLRDVSVGCWTQHTPPIWIGALSDKQGRYALNGLPEGQYRLELSRYAVRTGPG